MYVYARHMLSERSLEWLSKRLLERSCECHLNGYNYSVYMNGLVNDLVNVRLNGFVNIHLSNLVNVHLNVYLIAQLNVQLNIERSIERSRRRKGAFKCSPQYVALFLTTFAFHTAALPRTCLVHYLITLH